MKAAILTIELLSNASLGSTGHLLLQLGAILMLLGLPFSLAAILWALRNTPEGFEDEMGFRFNTKSAVDQVLAGIAILRPHNAG